MKAKLITASVVAVAVLALYLYWRLGSTGFVLLIAGLVLAGLILRAAKWAFIPRGELPRNRVRCQRIRLSLRLHPGPGFATAWELHRHWSRTAAYKRAARVRSS